MGYVSLHLFLTINLTFHFSMGKTIQMIALLCTDKGAKPNLVVA